MAISRVFDSISKELVIPKELLPDGGNPFPHHFLSTPQDNLIELAGRSCYDSCKQEKTRSSKEYHDHINDVNHGSTQEHCNFTVELEYANPAQLATHNTVAMLCCVNRPGVWIIEHEFKVRITANVRSIIEWDKRCNNIVDKDTQIGLGRLIKELVRCKVPMAMAKIPAEKQRFAGKLVDPIFPQEKWYSFYVYDVSRALTHELVRHKYHTAISQRSTRYVDESESPWVWHPLIVKYQEEIINQVKTPCGTNIFETQEYCQLHYKNLVCFLEEKLISEGVDKFSAKKQSRGAARGILGNALSTELIWSASLEQIAEVIRQRNSAGADLEINLLAEQLYDLMKIPLEEAGFKLANTPHTL